MEAIDENKSKQTVVMAWKAIHSDNVKALRAIVEENLWVIHHWAIAGGDESSPRDGNAARTLFHVAALGDHVLCVNYLASKGADMHSQWNRSTGQMSTPLSLVIMCGEKKKRERMFASLMKQASATSPGGNDSGWQTAMAAAAIRGHEPIMSAIAQFVGPRGNLLWRGICDYDGERLLHFVARGGSEEALALALSFDGIPEQQYERCSRGHTPIEMAEMCGRSEIAKQMALRENARREQADLQKLVATEAMKASSLRI